MIAAADNDESARSVRDFNAKVGAAALAYEPLMDRMLKATERDDRAASVAATSFPNLL